MSLYSSIRARAFALGLRLILLSSPAALAQPLPPNVPIAPAGDNSDLTPVYPNEGAWWNPAEPGNGWLLEVDELSGFLFLTWYTYEADGDPIFYLMQGRLQVALERDRVRGATWARLSAPLSVVRNGQTPGGPHRPPQVADAGLGTAEVRFFDARRGEFRLGGRVTPIRVFTTETQEKDLLVGDWQLIYRALWPEGLYFRVPQQLFFLHWGQPELRIRATDRLPIVVSTSNPPGSTSTPYLDPPPPDVLQYRPTCLKNCGSRGNITTVQGTLLPNDPNPSSTAVPNWLFWHDPTTGRMQQDVVLFSQSSAQTQIIFDLGGMPTTLFITPDRIVGRGREARTRPSSWNPPPNQIAQRNLHLPIEYVMMRVPENFDSWLGHRGGGTATMPVLTNTAFGADPGRKSLPADQPIGVDAADLTATFPNEGAWWNPAEPGNGWLLDVDERTGFVFLTWYTYEADGDPIFYLLQGRLQLRPERERLRGAPWATLSGPLSVVRNGQTPGGPHRPPQVGDAGLGTAEVRFFDARRGEFRLGGRVTPIRVFTTETAERDLLEGLWLIRYRFQPVLEQGPTPVLMSGPAMITIRRAPDLRLVTEVGSLGSGPPPHPSAFQWDPPPPGAVPYTAFCSGGCTSFGELQRVPVTEGRPEVLRPGSWVFWYDPDSGRVQMDVVQRIGGDNPRTVLNHNSMPTAIFLYPNRMVGRGRYALNPNADGSGLGPLHLPFEFIAVRIPSEFPFWAGRNPIMP